MIAKLTALSPLLALPFLTQPVHADVVQLQPAMTFTTSTWVPIDCMFDAGGEFPHYWVKNTTNAPIHQGATVRWSTSYGPANNSTTTTLGSPVPAGGSIYLDAGPTGVAAVTCKASFNAGPPDIAVNGVRWTSETTAQVDLANENPWIMTGAFSVRVGSLKCVSVPVHSVDSPSMTLAKGEHKTITVNIPKSGAIYLKALADFDDKVKEANEANNAGSSAEYQQCLPK